MVVEVGPMPYPVINTILDDGFPTGSLNYWLSSFTSGMPDELIDLAAERFAIVPSPMTTILFEHFHGAVTRVGVSDTAVPHRERGLEPRAPVGLDWIPPTPTRTSRWTRDTHAAFAEHLTEGRWLNYLADDQGDGRDPRRVRAELRPARRGEAQGRPAQRLQAEPQHRSVARRPAFRARASAVSRPDRHVSPMRCAAACASLQGETRIRFRVLP